MSRPSNTASIQSDRDASHFDRLFAVARLLSAGMARGDVITRPSSRDQTIRVFGINDAGGAWTVREASMPSKSRKPSISSTRTVSRDRRSIPRARSTR